MKKIYKCVCAAMVTAGALMTVADVSAQMASPLNVAKRVLPNQKTVNLSEVNKPISKVSKSTTTTTESDVLWLSDAVANDYIIGGGTLGTAEIYSYPLFPDTLGLFNFNGGAANTLYHLISNVFDPFASNLQTAYGLNWTQNQYVAYSIDSLAVEFSYHRNLNNGVADTLVVYLYTDSNPVNTPIYKIPSPPLGSISAQYFPDPSDTLTDTVCWKQMLYDAITNSPLVASGTYMQTIKVPLTEADTVASGYVQYKYFSTNGTFNVPAGAHVCSAFGFIPGYAYTNGSNIDNTKNSFSIAFYEEQGSGNTNPLYFGTGGPNSGAKDWNVTGFATTGELYNTESTNGEYYFDSTFVPLWWMGAVYSPFYDHEALVQYHATANFNTGVSEVASSNGVNLYQNQPNPANHGTTLIQYDTKAEGTVNLEVTDLTGRVVMLLNQGTQSAGSHIVTMDVSGLSQGMYLYTLRTNNESITKRMVIGQ